MTDFVIDNSVIISWAFPDEHNKESKAILQKLKNVTAYVPPLWPYELANALCVAEKKKRIKKADVATFIKKLNDLSISIERQTYDRITKDVLAISREHGLTIYDAAYVDLALHKGIPLVTFDKEIKKVCQKIGL